MALGREALGRKHFKQETIHVPEWDGDVILRGMTAGEQSHIQELATKGVNTKEKSVTNSNAISAMARYAVIYGWIDEDGNNVLTKEDLKALQDEPFSVIQRLSAVVMRLSGLQATSDDSSAVDDAEKNFGMAMNDAFGSS